MVKLDDYLKDAKLTNAAFAERLAVSEATISRLRNGKQAPSWDLIQRIVAETSGKITPNDFLSPEYAAPTSAEAAE